MLLLSIAFVVYVILYVIAWGVVVFLGVFKLIPSLLSPSISLIPFEHLEHIRHAHDTYHV